MSYLIRLNGREHVEHDALSDAVIEYTLLVTKPGTATVGLYGPRRLPPFKREVIAEYVHHLEAEAEAPATKTVETSTNQSVSTMARLNSEGEAYGVSLSVREGRRETSVMLTRGEARHVAQDLLAATQQHL